MPGSPVANEELHAEERAKLSSPEAKAEREASRTKFEGLDGEQARHEAVAAFPATIDEPAGGPPKLPAGQSIVGYASDHVAQVDLGEGKHAAIESTDPIAVETSPGQRKPLDLRLNAVGDGFRPATPAVGVVIPKHLTDGVQLPGSGISLTPVDAGGQPLEGEEGAIEGQAVVYPNTQRDTDTIAKPTTYGFALDSVLRSAQSPDQLRFHVELPEGATLVQPKDGSGSVRIMRAGVAVATILPPEATDAAGTAIPVSMRSSGGLLTVTVDTTSGEPDYPIDVDPEVWDEASPWLVEGAHERPSNFHFIHEGSQFVANETGEGASWRWTESVGASHKTGEWGALAYTTQGDSYITSLSVDGTWNEKSDHLENLLEIVSPTKESESKWILPEESPSENDGYGISAPEVEGGPRPAANNSAEYLTESNGEGGGGGNILNSAKVEVGQETYPEITFNTKSPTVDGQPNVMYGSSNWLGPKSGAAEFTAEDKGVGIKSWSAEYSNAEGKDYQGLASRNFLNENVCAGIQCEPKVSEYIKYSSVLPNGEPTLGLNAASAIGWSQGSERRKVKVDATPPTGLALTGVGSGNQIGEGEYTLKGEATDSLSGIKSLTLTVDGREVGKPNGSCPSGPCTAKGEWQINGGEFGVGEHKLTVIATDNAGNVEKGEFTLKVRHSTPVPLGPGSVNPQSGELTLGATDVGVSAPGSNLEVTRDYRSRHLTAGAEGPLGPQWSLNVGSEESITKQPNGNVTLVSANGGQTTFVTLGKGAFTSPTGDTNLALSEVENAKKELEYVLKDASSGETTHFSPTSSTSMWKPGKQEGPLPSQAVKYLYEPVEGVTELKYALAPEPAGVTTCLTRLEKKEELVKGCRALEFKYDTSKTATGEGEKQWGEYVGRLKEVLFVAYSPTTKAITKTPVARYLYDAQGRLRAEWNPKIEPGLKTVYGYDAEGHVTVLTSAGQQPWIFTYGTLANDSSAGRLLSAARPTAGAAKELGAEPKYGSGIALSTTPLPNETVTAEHGSWSNGPLSYSYQWEDCNSSGKECTPILGATNESYVPLASDYNHSLVVEVSATNADGTVLAESAASALVPRASTYLGFVRSFGNTGSAEDQVKDPVAVAGTAGPSEEFVASYGTNRVERFNGTGEFIGWLGAPGTGAGDIEHAESLAVNGTGKIWVGDSGNHRIDEFTTSNEFLKSFGSSGKGKGQFGGAIGGLAYEGAPNGYIWASDTADSRLESFNAEGSFQSEIGSEGSGEKQVHGPYGIAHFDKALSSPDLYVADSGNHRIQQFLPSGATESIGKQGTESGQLEEPSGIAEEEVSKRVQVSDAKTDRVQVFGPSGEFIQSIGSPGSASTQFNDPRGIANVEGVLYVADSGNNRIDEYDTQASSVEPVPPAPKASTNAVWTVEYRVPVSGAGAPNELGSAAVKAWGQTDDPTEGMAVFPPDEPQGWPATDYKHATITYLDAEGRTVNASSPTGGISTSEYNPFNDVVRTLSPDNRATALAAGEKSSEVAKELSAESTYNETGSEPGTELLSTLGPKHDVELTNGTQVEAREHTVYSYNEGAPAEGGPYHLATTTTEGAEIAGKEEPESVRTTKTSYKGPSGHESLGWTLRKPTSVTTDPTGLDLVHTTEYEPGTGNVIETKMPAASGKDERVPPAYSGTFGTKGTAAGDFTGPAGDAVDAAGDVWVVDSEDNRVEKFSATGGFIGTMGFGVSNGEAKFQICTSSCRAGISGAGNGQFSEPAGIAIAGGKVYVADFGNDRIETFTENGEYTGQFGSKGTGAGQLEGPAAVAVGDGGVWVGELLSHRDDRFSTAGAFEGTAGYGVSNGEAKYEICTSGCRAGISGTGPGQFKEIAGIAATATHVYIVDSGNDRVDVIGGEGEYERAFGSKGTGNGQFTDPTGISLAGNHDLYISDAITDTVQAFNISSPTSEYMYQFESKGTGAGQASGAEDIAANSASDAYVVDTGDDRIVEWAPTVTGSEAAHDTKTIYYTTAANTETGAKECGEHAEWANLPCLTKPAAQPGTAGLPELPTTKYAAYNVWDAPESIIETVGSTTRTETNTYDEAGRPKTSGTTSTVGTAVPTVTYTYSKETGALEKESAGAKTMTSTLNTLGQLTSYTDASEVTSTYEYDIDGRIHKTNDGKGTQTYTYNEVGLLSELVDSSAAGMKFTATYDAEGNMLTEGYPNGMSAIYAYNAQGMPTALEYKKITDCTEEKEKCKWFTDTVVPSIHGQWLSQASTLSKQAYTYDQAGRLTQVQNTPTGGDCTTRIYGYDEDTNRTSLTTRSSSSEKCATEGGSTESHTYDTADRLTGAGFSYNEFGDITTVPALGSEDPEMTSAYYVDNQLSGQKQKEQRIGYNLDPAGRTIETVATGKPLIADTTFNYDGPGENPSWTNNATASEWSRNIPGIDGSLAAIQTNGAAPVLQLPDLHGDIVATASTSETATALASKTDTSEFGVPTVGSPSTYSWLGAEGLRTELPSGAINMGARSYVPQLGRFLQPDPIPGGSANAYSYTFGDPVNTSDPTGMFVEGAYLYAFNSEENQRSVEREAAREAAAKAAAEQAAREAQEAAERAAGPQYGEAGPLGGYEGWACEYAAATDQEQLGCGGGGDFPIELALSCNGPDKECHGATNPPPCPVSGLLGCSFSDPERDPPSGHGGTGDGGANGDDGDGDGGSGEGAGGCCGHRIG